MSDRAPDSKMLCHCRNVRYGTVRRCVHDEGARTVEKVMEACDAGTGCRTCHHEIREVLAEVPRPGILGWLRRLFGAGGTGA